MDIINKELKFTFIIPSYNRFDKLINLISQINLYDNVSIIIFNDASIDERYNTLTELFNNLTVIHNLKNNGKELYNKSIFDLISASENIDFDYAVMLADDFILCDNFTTLLSNILTEYNIINVFSIHETNWQFRGWIDGAFACSKKGLNIIKSNIPKKPLSSKSESTGIWRSVSQYFNKNFAGGYKLVTLNYSLTQHDGNYDSKLHPTHRLNTPIIAKNFYNDFYNNEIKIIGDSTMAPAVIKKKETGLTNGNKSKNNTKDEITESPTPIVQNYAVIKSPIEFDKSKLDSIKKGLETPKQSRISKIGDDVFVAKSRKRNLRLGGR